MEQGEVSEAQWTSSVLAARLQPRPERLRSRLRSNPPGRGSALQNRHLWVGHMKRREEKMSGTVGDHHRRRRGDLRSDWAWKQKDCLQQGADTASADHLQWIRDTHTHTRVCGGRAASPWATPASPCAKGDYRCCGSAARCSRPGECGFVCLAVDNAALKHILLSALAPAPGQDPDKRLLWCLCRSPVQNTRVQQGPVKRTWMAMRRTGSGGTHGIYGASEPWLPAHAPPHKWSVDWAFLWQ